MKTLVTYHSNSGNTEKIARAIFDGLDTTEKTLLPMAEVNDSGEYDVVFAGFPVQAHSVPVKPAAFIEALPGHTKLVLFASHGALQGGELAVTALYHALGLAKGSTVLGTFDSQGEVPEAVLEALADKPEHRGWVWEARAAAGHPDQADLAEARDFARLMLLKAENI